MNSRQRLDKKIWQRIVTQEQVETSTLNIDPYLQQVWERCCRQQDYATWVPPHRAKGATFKNILKNKKQLLNIAIPTIEDLAEHMECTPCSFILTDETGCTLYINHHPQIQERMDNLGILDGAYWHENIIGNNAISSALHLANVSTSIEYEHFKQTLHDFAIFAAPLFDNTGNIQGCFALVFFVDDAYPCANALVHSATHDIASQLQVEHLLSESNQYLSEMHTLLDSVDEGVVSWLPNGHIEYFNHTCSNILGLSVNDLGKKINTLFKIPAKLERAIKKGKDVSNLDIIIECKGKLVSLSMSLKVVRNEFNRVNSYIVLFAQQQNEIETKRNGLKNNTQYTFDDIIAQSNIMRDTIYHAQHAAKGHGAIFIQGKEGSGRRQLAQAIHNASNRHKKPFISINCNAIPQEHMIKEFLTSSQDGIASKFELANGGTLYLEHIENLIPEVQAALLQLIKTGLFNRMNGKITSLDLRIITTSNVDLEQKVAEKHFSKQLLWELNTFVVKLPKLRKHTEDIPPFVARELALLSSQQRKTFTISDAALNLLMQYQWPGELRELENVIERAATVAHSEHIEVSDLPDHIRLLKQGYTNQTSISCNNLSELEKKAIVRSATQFNGKIADMCQDLQISRTTLWRKIKTYQLDITDYKK